MSTATVRRVHGATPEEAVDVLREVETQVFGLISLSGATSGVLTPQEKIIQDAWLAVRNARKALAREEVVA